MMHTQIALGSAAAKKEEYAVPVLVPVSYTHLVDTVWLTRRQSAAVHLSDIPLSGIFHLWR